MAYDPDLDKVVKEFTHENGLCVSINRYNGGDEKVQIGPRVIGKGTIAEKKVKAGRLSKEEFEWVCSLREKIEKCL
ncbi:MAG: hypothetical protein AB1401_00600 [Thermodesulfobacteriota bacterium]